MGVSLACSLFSPTPASWAGTPTAEARAATNTAFVKTQQAGLIEEPTPVPSLTPTFDLISPTPSPTIAADGPWLVYPAPDGQSLRAFDVENGEIIAINLPTPIYFEDLSTGRHPNGRTLIIRAGSPSNTDELALYAVSFLEGTFEKISPLLSIALQRSIINEDSSRSVETLNRITGTQTLAWSPNGRFLAFLAALDNDSSDLYVYDTVMATVTRLNGLFSHSATPFWAPQNNWLITPQVTRETDDSDWQAEDVTALRMPSFDDQQSVYLPRYDSVGEVFLGWLNSQSFVSYSQTPTFPHTLRNVNVETGEVTLIYQGYFDVAALDPETRSIALVVNEANASPQGWLPGVYLLRSEDVAFGLEMAGIWESLVWDQSGVFVASGTQGAFLFSPDDMAVLLGDEKKAAPSPDASWLIAWGDGISSPTGLRLYQSPSGSFLQNISESLVSSVFWRPDSKAFFVVSEGVLYYVRFPSLNLEKVDEGFPAGFSGDLIWIES